MSWPKTLRIGRTQIDVDSWAEVKEAIEVFGADVAFHASEVSPDDVITRPAVSSRSSNHSSFSATDRTLLEQFLEAGPRGVLTSSLGQALGKRGKGIRPALEVWSRRVGLVTEQDATAFEQVKRFDGRGYRMVDHYLRAASQLLGR